jgi:hypothetical protein
VLNCISIPDSDAYPLLCIVNGRDLNASLLVEDAILGVLLDRYDFNIMKRKLLGDEENIGGW